MAAGGAAASSASPHYAARIKVAGQAGVSARERERAARTVRTRTGHGRDGARSSEPQRRRERWIDGRQGRE